MGRILRNRINEKVVLIEFDGYEKEREENKRRQEQFGEGFNIVPWVAEITKNLVQRLKNHPYQHGDYVKHKNRGPCIFLEVDTADPSGDTVWVRFDEADEECMVSTSLLIPWWPPGKEEENA